MADENVPAPAPTRYDDQILPFAAWVPIGKSNYISVDILSNTNFFRAFNASASFPTIYIQQFCNTLTYVEKAGTYRFQLDENWFTLDANLLREALEITPIDQAHPFVSPPSGDAIMDFLTKKGRKDKPHVIMCCRFMKLIICHLGRTHNIHQRSTPLFHLAEEDLRLAEKEGKKTASAKQPKSKSATEKSSKPAPASKPKPAKEKPSKPSTANPPKPKPAKEKSTKATPLQKTGKGKVVKVRNVKSSFQLVDEPDEEPAQPEPKTEPEHQGEGKEYDMECAIQMSLESFHAQGHAHVRGVAIREPVAEATRPLPVVEGKGKAIRWTSATKEESTGPSAQQQDAMSANIVRDSSSNADAETITESDKTNSGGDTEIL
ncbi:hypothetical protein Tco_0641621 [Tanacetum coccineum]